jgi:hypothetical protein
MIIFNIEEMPQVPQRYNNVVLLHVFFSTSHPSMANGKKALAAVLKDRQRLQVNLLHKAAENWPFVRQLHLSFLFLTEGFHQPTKNSIRNFLAFGFKKDDICSLIHGPHSCHKKLAKKL